MRSTLAPPAGIPQEVRDRFGWGDVWTWTWTALDSTSKLMITWADLPEPANLFDVTGIGFKLTHDRVVGVGSQLSSCHSKYQYDEERFERKPSKRIKCARCQQIFEIQNPAFEAKPAQVPRFTAGRRK